MKPAPFLTMVVAISAALAAASCHRDRKAEQMAALDRGYAAGVLTKEEYEAKKAMVVGTVPAPEVAKASAPPPAPETPPAPVETAPPVTPPAPETVRPPTPQRSAPPKQPAVRELPPPNREPEPAAPAPAPPPPAQTSAPPASEPWEEPAPLAGCVDGGAKPGKEKGKQERFFPMPVARVKQAAIGALEALEFKVNSNSGQEIEATKKRHFGVVGSGGEKMVLRFEASQANGQPGTLVIGETKKGIIGRVGQKSWTNAVLAQTGCMLRR